MHIDRTDREAGTQRERETADSWLAKQTDRQQTSLHLHIFPSLTSYIFTSWHLLIFTSSHLHIHLHIFSSSHFSSSHLLIFTPSKISSHLHILTSSSPRRSAEPPPEPKWTPGLIHRYYDSRGSGIWTFQPRKAQKAGPRNKASQTFCGTFSGTKVNPWNHPQILRPAGVRNLDLSAPKKLKKRAPASRQTTSPQNTNISQRLDRSWMSVCCAECSSLSATAARLAAESPRPRTHQWPRETMACAAAPADPLEQPSARRLHLRKSHLPEECIWEKAICQKNDIWEKD